MPELKQFEYRPKLKKWEVGDIFLYTEDIARDKSPQCIAQIEHIRKNHIFVDKKERTLVYFECLCLNPLQGFAENERFEITFCEELNEYIFSMEPL